MPCSVLRILSYKSREYGRMDFDAVDADLFQLTAGDVLPFGALGVIVENGRSEKQVIAIVLGNKPVTATNEEMQVDELVFMRDGFGFVQAGDFV